MDTLTSFASDTAQIAVTPFTVHILFGATRPDGVVVPQGNAMLSVAFARFLHRMLTDALAVADRAPPPAPVDPPAALALVGARVG